MILDDSFTSLIHYPSQNITVFFQEKLQEAILRLVTFWYIQTIEFNPYLVVNGYFICVIIH